MIVVEGESDRQAVRRAVDMDCVITSGHALSAELLQRLRLLQQRRGLIILTDPDYAGEQIRRRLQAEIPEALHAYLPRDEAMSGYDCGIEHASPQAIRQALTKLHSDAVPSAEKSHTTAADANVVASSTNATAVDWTPLTWSEYLRLGLTGRPDSARRRQQLGEALGIGQANARQLFLRLNSYRIDRAEIAGVFAEETLL